MSRGPFVTTDSLVIECGYFAPGQCATYCDRVSVCLSVCLLVCVYSLAYVNNNTSKISQNFMCVLLAAEAGASLPAMRYVMYFRFCG